MKNKKLIKPPNEKPETKKMIRGSMRSNGFKGTNEYQEIWRNPKTKSSRKIKISVRVYVISAIL